MKGQHHTVGSTVVAALLFNKNAAAVSRYDSIDQEGLLVNPVANGVLGIEFYFDNVIVSLIGLSRGDELTFDGSV